jgi:hypothetical protein
MFEPANGKKTKGGDQDGESDVGTCHRGRFLRKGLRKKTCQQPAGITKLKKVFLSQPARETMLSHALA